mgnify:CR=1 FL=1
MTTFLDIEKGGQAVLKNLDAGDHPKKKIVVKVDGPFRVELEEGNIQSSDDKKEELYFFFVWKREYRCPDITTPHDGDRIGYYKHSMPSRLEYRGYKARLIEED